MNQLIHSFRIHLETHQDRLRLFSELEFQSEGWFKTEFLLFLSGARSRGDITNFSREVKHNGKQIDFEITQNGITHLVEAKHWLIGEQRGAVWTARNYFQDETNIVTDVRKLLEIPNCDRWILIFATRNPGHNDWQDGVQAFHNKYARLSVVTETDPNQFPEYYFCGLLHVLPNQR
ncbi:MAG TPA: hypothetical protein VNI77_01700 [Nitrososphaera sp.]|nr:hypothetical protein [Nitrososphaera sp.]